MPTPPPRSSSASLLGACLGALLLLAACPVEGAKGSHSLGGDSPVTGASSPPDASAPGAAAPRAAAPPDASAPRVAAPPNAALVTPPDASAPRVAAPPNAALVTPPAVEDPTNQVKPLDEARWLDQQGRALFAALASGDARRADGFFFPRAPFAKLKRAGNPDGYWQHLLALYAQDVARTRRRHTDWAGATFESLALQGPPEWVAPGEEHNHIGYHRARYGRLRYAHGGQRYSIFVHTLITWQGRWYITHLGPPRPLGAPARRATPPPR